MKKNTLLTLLAIGLITITSETAPAICTYTYTGNNFTEISGTTFTNDMYVSGSLTLSTAPGKDFFGAVTPSSFVFTAGIGNDIPLTITDQDSLQVRDFVFRTNDTGAIIDWSIFLTPDSNLDDPFPAILISSFPLPEINQPIDIARIEPGSEAFNNNPGSWEIICSTPDAGATIALLSLSLTALVVAGRRFKPVAA